MTQGLGGRAGFQRMSHALGNSVSGLRMAYAGEIAFRQEVWAAAVLVPSAFWLGDSWVEVALLAGAVVLVLVVELLNSAIEAVVDRVSYDWHELSKRAKDIGSAAVLLSLLNCAGVWLVALVHHFGGSG